MASGFLNPTGHGKVYYKPFNTLKLEDDLMRAMKVPSQVPQELLSGNTDELDSDDEESA